MIKRIVLGLLIAPICLISQNQTKTLSPVLAESSVPFSLTIKQADFSLPSGLQAYAKAIYNGKWVLLAGRTNGLHGFSNHGNAFPPAFQNTDVFIVDPSTGCVRSHSLTGCNAELSQSEVDALSVTMPQFFQKGKMLYLVGGYGIDTATGQMETKSTLTAVDLEKLIDWAEGGSSTAKSAIRQVDDPFLQVTGGALFQNSDQDPFLLILGQNFSGLYRDNSNGVYTKQIRPFWLNDEGGTLTLTPISSKTSFDEYRRRDLNVAPVIYENQPAYIAFSGVFTLSEGIWTVPIAIFPDGSSLEPNSGLPDTFCQAMSHYNCANFGLYSTESQDMYAIFAGGMSYGYFSDGIFYTDPDIPFLNQVTAIKIDQKGNFTQYLMNGEYPFIPSTGSNPGNQLLFGSDACFFPAAGIPSLPNGVIQLDSLGSTPTLIGYIVGGIMSTLPSTNSESDSTSSPYIFTVELIPK